MAELLEVEHAAAVIRRALSGRTVVDAKPVRRSIAAFEREYVHEGKIENPFVVYDRAGEPCPRCKTPLEKRTIGGRSSTSCPSCQR